MAIKLEYCDGSSWQPLASEGYVNTTVPNLAVTSVAITGSPGLSVAGSPITGIGTIGLTLNLELQSLANLSATGLMTRTGTATYTGRSLVAGSGISVTNANGLAGNPTIAVSTIDINNNTSGQLNTTRLSGYPNNSNFFLKGNGTWNYLASNGSYNLISGTGAFPDHVLLVNLEGKFGSGKYNAVCYGNSGQAAVEFFYGGVLKSYINPSGVLISASHAKLKNSMRKKDIFKKDYLERILNLDVYSYTWKSADSTKHTSNHVAVGPLYGDVARLFNGNALSHPKAREGFVCNLKNCPQCHPEFKGINLAEILSYLILAFQSFYHKEYLPLKNTILIESKKPKVRKV